jgi:hypothetical protein
MAAREATQQALRSTCIASTNERGVRNCDQHRTRTDIRGACVMPGPGLEPGRGFPQGILSPLRLPLSPSRLRPADSSASEKQRRGNGSVRSPAGSIERRAGNGTRTRDPNLGKVVLYQLSYSRADRNIPVSFRGYKPMISRRLRVLTAQRPRGSARASCAFISRKRASVRAPPASAAAPNAPCCTWCRRPSRR